MTPDKRKPPVRMDTGGITSNSARSNRNSSDVSSLTQTPGEVTEAIDIARYLADNGVPIFVAKRAETWPDGGTGNTGYLIPKGWHTTKADSAVLDDYVPGDAVCAVMGHAVDAIDLDPRAGGVLPAELQPKTYGVQSTPSGGTHELVAPLGVRSRDGILPGVDIKAGTDGQGTGFIFIAPTERKNHAGDIRPYRWIDKPDLDMLTLIGVPENTGQPLAELIEADRTPATVTSDYDGPEYAALEPTHQAMAQQVQNEKLEHWRVILADAATWAEGERDARGRGWEALARDFAWTVATVAANPWMPLSEHDAAEVYADIMPEAIAADPKCRGKLTGHLIRKAAEHEPVEAPPWEEFEVTPMQKTARWNDTGLRSHQRIAKRLSQYVAGKALFVHGSGWHYWTGTHWAPDLNQVRINELLEQLLTTSWAEAVHDKGLAADVRSAMTSSGARGVIDLASKSHDVFTAQVDQDPFLLNVRNGTLDLHTLELRPHDPADRITKIAQTEYDPEATAHTWERFLATSLPDPAVRGFVQRYIGLSLIGQVIEHIMVIAYGDTGRNGKGVLARTVSKALGDYAVTATNTLLVTGRHGGMSAGELAAQMVLRGARFVVMSELGRADKMNEALLKTLTGGDEITAKLMGQNFVSFTPSHSFFMQTNTLAAMDANDEAAWSRVRVVPFEVSFKGREDHELEQRLTAELAGVLTWAVEGLRQYQQRGLDEPAAVKRTTLAYRDENDTIRQFVADRCHLEATARVTTEDLTAEYNHWAHLNGAEHLNARQLGKQLSEAMDDITPGYVSRKRGWHGIGLGPGGEIDEVI